MITQIINVFFSFFIIICTQRKYDYLQPYYPKTAFCKTPMKKEYIFVVLIIIMLYMVYLVLSYKYTEYKINSNIEYLSELKQEFSGKIEEAENIIEYTNTKAYKNKILKQHQSLKNK